MRKERHAVMNGALPARPRAPARGGLSPLGGDCPERCQELLLLLSQCPYVGFDQARSEVSFNSSVSAQRNLFVAGALSLYEIGH